jgi:hypothetical protein
MRTPPSRWAFHDPALLWLFPATYLAHLLEEWFARAPILLWTLSLRAPLDSRWFLGANSLGLALMIVAVRLVPRGPRWHWIAPALATSVLLNSVGHLAGALMAGHYSAGLATAVILWIPLGMLTLARAAHQARISALWWGVTAGALVDLAVIGAIIVSGMAKTDPSL